MERPEHEEKAKLEWLRAAAREGFGAIERGDYSVLASGEEVTQLLRRIHDEAKADSDLREGEPMARMIPITVRLEERDVRALKRARAERFSGSDLLRQGLRVVASRYYSDLRPPSTLLFESTDSKLGDESELFRVRSERF